MYIYIYREREMYMCIHTYIYIYIYTHTYVALKTTVCPIFLLRLRLLRFVDGPQATAMFPTKILHAKILWVKSIRRATF